jgi:site-specific recombinase XerD
LKSQALLLLNSHTEPEENSIAENFSLSDLIDRIKLALPSVVRPATLRSYTGTLKTLKRIIGNKLLSEISRADIERFKLERLNSISAVTLNIELRSLKAVFNRCVKWELLETSPLAGIELCRIKKLPPVFLTKPDFETLIKSTNSEYSLFSVTQG